MAFTTACEYAILQSTGRHVELSCLFINYNGRLVHSNTLVNFDLGSSAQFTAMGLAQYGVCEETLWKCHRKNINRKPSSLAYDRGRKFSVTVGQVPEDLLSMKTCLANGLPFIASIIVSKSARREGIETNGYLSLPDPRDPEVRHAKLGHAVLIVGYNDEIQHFIVRNSWGPHWVRT